MYNTSKLFQLFKQAAKNPAAANFHAPRGNSKLGSIPAFNLLPGVSCSAVAHKTCLKGGCYAVKNVLCHGDDPTKNVCLRAWIDNTIFAKYRLPELTSELTKYFQLKRPAFFRLHSSGDFISVEYAKMWWSIAAANPNTKFLAFTKKFGVLDHVDFSELSNFELVLSAWPGIDIPAHLRTKYRVAWMDDGTDCRIPHDALKCPGSCTNCGMCWNLSRIGRDTVFHRH